MPGVMAPAFHQIVGHQFVGAEAADGEQGTIHSQGWNDGIDARSIAQAGIHHGRRFVHAPPDLRHDLVDDSQQVRIIAKRDVGQLEQTFAFDINLLVCVDQNVGDGRVLQQRLERTKPEYFIEDLVADLLFFERTE